MGTGACGGDPAMSMRLLCIVPFCPHTRGDRKGDPVREGMEWICGSCWRRTSLTWRRRYALFKRRDRPELAVSMWARLKAQAIERAAGI